MKNHEIVRALPHLKSLKIELEVVKDQIMRLQNQSLQLDQEIRVLEGVNNVIDGVAVYETKDPNKGNIYGRHFTIRTVGADDHLHRSAEVYPNAHTSENGIAKDWGIKIYVANGGRGRDEDWLNVGWAFRDAVAVARRWTVHGEKPSKDAQDMARTRHQFDPDGRASKRRREAYEAAWLAGHQQLAEEIITGRAKCAAKPKKPVEEPVHA